ncbi:hypothetical protein CLF_104310 [Clonorchis sinensis]|uniref:C2H2-type domain-containing protein n=1 Tax=Clonorchis sinensis TaxID=79923 RepID=G7YBD5_CLOSI|nr:hypothetical protein CLF_104310 [Clonorchis sinensis]
MASSYNLCEPSLREVVAETDSRCLPLTERRSSLSVFKSPFRTKNYIDEQRNRQFHEKICLFPCGTNGQLPFSETLRTKLDLFSSKLCVLQAEVLATGDPTEHLGFANRYRIEYLNILAQPKQKLASVQHTWIKNITNERKRTQLMADEIVEGIKACLNRIHFVFDPGVYTQEQGLAMGSPISPVFANIFIGDFEHPRYFRCDETRQGRKSGSATSQSLSRSDHNAMQTEKSQIKAKEEAAKTLEQPIESKKCRPQHNKDHKRTNKFTKAPFLSQSHAEIADSLQMLYKRMRTNKKYSSNCVLMMSSRMMTKRLEVSCQARPIDQRPPDHESSHRLDASLGELRVQQLQTGLTTLFGFNVLVTFDNVDYKTSGASAPVPTSTQERLVGLTCEECGKWCKSKAGLVAHHRVHDNDSVGTNMVAQLACADCSRLFPTKIGMSQHRRHAHPTQHNAGSAISIKTKLRVLNWQAQQDESSSGGPDQTIGQMATHSSEADNYSVCFKQTMDYAVSLLESHADGSLASVDLLALARGLQSGIMTPEQFLLFLDLHASRTFPHTWKTVSRRVRQLVHWMLINRKQIRRADYAAFQTLYHQRRKDAASAVLDGSWKDLYKGNCGLPLDVEQYWKQVLSAPKHVDSRPSRIVVPSDWSLLEPITSTEVGRAISLMGSSSPGLDELTPRMLRRFNANSLAGEFAKRLRRLIYTVFEELRTPISTFFSKPDLIAVRERLVTVLDVSIVPDWRGVAVWNEKKQTYDADEYSLAIISALRAIG